MARVRVKENNKDAGYEMKPYWQNDDCTLYTGDAAAILAELPPNSVQMVMTSPPYWSLRDYSAEGQIGLEDTLEEHIDNLVEVFRGVRSVPADRPDQTVLFEKQQQLL